MLAMLQILVNFWEFPSSLIFYYFQPFHYLLQFQKDWVWQKSGGLHPIILSLHLNTEYFRWKKLMYWLVIYFCFSIVKLIFLKVHSSLRKINLTCLKSLVFVQLLSWKYSVRWFPLFREFWKRFIFAILGKRLEYW